MRNGILRLLDHSKERNGMLGLLGHSKERNGMMEGGGEGRERRWLHTVAKSPCFVVDFEVLEEDRKGMLSLIVRKRGKMRRGF